MKKQLIIAGVVIALALVALLGVFANWYDSAVKHENAILAQYQDNQSRYDNFWKSVKEVAQVTDEYKEGFREVLHGAIAGRYGSADAGNQACARYIREQNPALSEASYARLQKLIADGRADFVRSQTALLDKQRAYRNHVQSFTGAPFAALAGFPRELAGEQRPSTDIDGDGAFTVLDYRIVTSTTTASAFDSGKDDKPIDVFGEE